MSDFEYYPIDVDKDRYPYCIVWTPIPFLTWLFPLLGHMGIAMSNGIIRDFAGSYFVSEDYMAFGSPTKYWRLHAADVGQAEWDRAVLEASEIYKQRIHNLCCDNCHSHVATALNLMKYNKSSKWNMVNVAFHMMLHSKYVNALGWIKTWVPFFVIITLFIMLYVVQIYVF